MRWIFAGMSELMDGIYMLTTEKTFFRKYFTTEIRGIQTKRKPYDRMGRV